MSLVSVFALILAYRYVRLKQNYDRLLSENNEDANVLFLKSRYASMGEMVGNIAHQWKQPLNAIGLIQNSIKAELLYHGEISKEDLLESVETSFKLIGHLADTIDTFYSFLSQRNHEKRWFSIAEELEAVRKITEYSFENSSIALNFVQDTNPTVKGSANEFTHAMLNIILNAKDAFDNTPVNTPEITVHVKSGDKTCTITVSDNAGGIRIEPLETVFDLHTTTKQAGSGLGLFMTKKIIENRFGGSIGVENKNGGACFTINLPYAPHGEHSFKAASSDEKLSLERFNELTRKIIELEELEKTLKKWADIFQYARWGIAIHVGASDKFELTNAAFNALYGYSAQEIKTVTVPKLYTQESISMLPRVKKEVNEKGYFAFETVHKRKDGSTFPVSIELFVVKDDKGEVLYRIANIWDLTEKKAAEDSLRLKRFALDKISEAIFLIDESGKFHYVNKRACHNLGYTKVELLTMEIFDIYPDMSIAKWKKLWNELEEYQVMRATAHHKRKDGTRITVEVSSHYFEHKGARYNLAVSRDITGLLFLQKQK